MPGIYPPLFSATGISSSAVPDPYVPVDGTMNVTGILVASSTIDAPQMQMDTASSHSADSLFTIQSTKDDGATAVAIRIAAGDDYTTSGAKILSIGDNAGTSYSEKAYISYTGTFSNQGGMAVGGVTSPKTADYTATVNDFLVLVDVNGAAGNINITLPLASSMKGQIIHIKNTSLHATRTFSADRQGSDTLTMITTTAQTTSGEYSCATNYQSTAFISDGVSVWYEFVRNA